MSLHTTLGGDFDLIGVYNDGPRVRVQVSHERGDMESTMTRDEALGLAEALFAACDRKEAFTGPKLSDAEKRVLVEARIGEVTGQLLGVPCDVPPWTMRNLENSGCAERVEGVSPDAWKITDRGRAMRTLLKGDAK